MRNICLLSILYIFFTSSNISGQAIFFEEGFESGVRPFGWDQQFVSGEVSWQYENGGYTTNLEYPTAGIR